MANGGDGGNFWSSVTLADPKNLNVKMFYIPELGVTVNGERAKQIYLGIKNGNPKQWAGIVGKIHAVNPNVKTSAQAMGVISNKIDELQSAAFVPTETINGGLNLFSYIDPGVEQSVTYGGGGGGPYTQRSTDVNLSSADEAGAYADAASEQQLGRIATNAERKDFQSALNRMEKQNPTKTVVHGSGGSNDKRTSRTTGGFDIQSFARDWARGQKDYAETYAATTFMDILDKVISNPSSIDQTIQGFANG